MAYILKKPCNEVQKYDFISKYNHCQGLEIKETPNAIYALNRNEKIENGIPVVNQNYEKELYEIRKKFFERNYFKTSLGWISRKFVINNGEEKDFFADILLQIKAALEIGMDIEIQVYKTPDFCVEPTKEYHNSLRIKKSVSMDFVKECIKISALEIMN